MTVAYCGPNPGQQSVIKLVLDMDGKQQLVALLHPAFRPEGYTEYFHTLVVCGQIALLEKLGKWTGSAPWLAGKV